MDRTALTLLAALALSCTEPVRLEADAGPDASLPLEPLRIAVMLPTRDGHGPPNIEWALENVNAAGGVAGRTLVADYIDLHPEAPGGPDFAALAEEVSADERYVAAIAPPGSPALQQVADVFIAEEMPVVSSTSASDDLLRAYGGNGFVWRTRESDVAQTELLVRFAQAHDAQHIAMVAALDATGSTFLTWFGFFARELGFPDDAVTLVPYEADASCADIAGPAFASGADLVFVAPATPTVATCIALASGPPEGRPRTVFADTGLDVNLLITAGPDAYGLEGFDGAGSEGYEQAFRRRFGETAPLAPHGPSEYDAVLLLAYGLELSQGRGGPALVRGLKRAVDGAASGSPGWEAEGIAANLSALRNGESPRLQGATGPLEFEPELYMDLVASTFAHWSLGPDGVTRDARYSTGDPAFLSSRGAFVGGSEDLSDEVETSTWQPAVPRTDTWALVAALSSGWDNYRHQADALQQYRLLRDAGVPDERIVLVLADDLGDVVRNTPGGPDLRAGAVIDYDLSVSGADLLAILRGEVGERRPSVLDPGPGSHVYVYLVGHGGEPGLSVNARTAGEGFAGEGDVLSPADLRAALCALRGRFRRTFVVVESCNGGVFGESADGGLEAGCDDGGPLEGAVLMSAANSREVSYAGEYDPALEVWVNDAFSRQFAVVAAARPDANLADLYADVYRGTLGSHVRFYNTAASGRMSAVSLAEFLAP